MLDLTRIFGIGGQIYRELRYVYTIKGDFFR